METQNQHLELYYAIFNLQIGNYTGAENTFALANKLWDGFGFKDEAYNDSYTSYKMVLDLILWKMLDNISETNAFATQYTAVMNQIIAVCSKLQASNGGVYTKYTIANGLIEPAGTENANTNGETTSLFVLADWYLFD